MKKFKSLLTIAAVVLLVLCCAMVGSVQSVKDINDKYAANEQTTPEALLEISFSPEPESQAPIMTAPVEHLTPPPFVTPVVQTTSLPSEEPEATPINDKAEIPLFKPNDPSPTDEPMIDVPYVPGYVNEVYVNLRAQPSVEAEIIRVYERETELIITGKNSEWFRVEIGNDVGYIARDYVTVGNLPTPVPTATPKPPSNPANPPNSAMYTVSPGQFSDEDIRLVAALIHTEGPGSTYVGYRAIASIVLNRVMNRSGRFPNTVSGVLFQKGQFGYSKAYLESVKPNSKALAAAQYVFSTHGSTLPKKVLFYRASYLGRNWYDYTRYYATIEGNCYFYGIKYF